ncbi:MAG: DUF4173 domain-containing protein [Candidatus Faecousia sp.]|nr:DUF4173 domain-containing protein [Candidatus Faecousia sp.]
MNGKKTNLLPLLASYVVGYLWVKCMTSGFLPDRRWDIPVFTLLFFLWGSWSLGKKCPASRESWFWMGCTGLISLCIGFERCLASELLAFLALHGFAAYWVVCRAGLLTEAITGPMLPLDAITAGILAPFGGFFLRGKTLSANLRNLLSGVRQGKWRSWVLSAVIFVIALPVLILTASLLGQADAAFDEVWEKLTGWLTWELSVDLTNFLFYLLLSLPVGAYLWGLVGSCLERGEAWFSGNRIRSQAEKLRKVPVIAILVVLGGFLALYLLFFGVQAGHLFGAFYGNVPGRLTAAQYAREGFFQLCAVMSINFGMLAFAARCSQVPLRQHGFLKGFSLVLLIQSLLLAITAAARLWLYITRFGFTPKRLLGAWAVAVLAVGCLLAIADILRPRKVIGKWILFAAGTFSLLCLY